MTNATESSSVFAHDFFSVTGYFINFELSNSRAVSLFCSSLLFKCASTSENGGLNNESNRGIISCKCEFTHEM